MDHFMPEIYWHDRDGMLSVDIHPTCSEDGSRYKIATCSMNKEVRREERVLSIGGVEGAQRLVLEKEGAKVLP